MKIAFVCGSLEPGRDGVGDYTRRLAAELINQGHSSVAISLNDKFITGKIEDVQLFNDAALPVLRLSSTLPLKIRTQHARLYIDDFDPEWLSLQFVIFGFHYKGLPTGLKRSLSTLGQGRKWQVMFHELWLGMESNTSKKHFLWGGVQKQIIKSITAAINPRIVHTHTDLYKKQLEKMGLDVSHLALFGNIPNNRKDKSAVNGGIEKEGKLLSLILFGHIHPKAPVDDFTADLAAYAAAQNIDIELKFVGRCGSEQELWTKKAKEKGLQIKIFGQQDVEDISTLLHDSSMGISTTPAALIEKSGSVAAMHEHGLTVICVPAEWQPKKFSNLKIPAGVIIYRKGEIGTALKGSQEAFVENSVSVIAHQMVDNLLKSA